MRRRFRGDKAVMIAGWGKRLGRAIVDFTLPPRCGGCGTIVDRLHSFCADCWGQIEFLRDGGCSACGIPLQATESESCAACLARRPRIERTRAAVAYDDLSRSLAIRLKYGRKVALARTMAHFMAPLIDPQRKDALLIPVPLHRSRLWQRGFNQSALVAAAIARRTGLRAHPNALRRIKRTPPLKGMTADQRRRTMAGAFRVEPAMNLTGRTVVLVDDVLTTGSTANACAKALLGAGAARVELITWARVIRPERLA